MKNEQVGARPVDRDSWNTPVEVLDRVRRIAPIGLDPCSNVSSKVQAHAEFVLPLDGLTMPWGGYGLIFVNPPFSQLADWAAKIHVEARAGGEIVMVAPANVETAPWQDHLWDCNAVCFPRGRITFCGADGQKLYRAKAGQKSGNPPRPSLLIYFGERPKAFRRAFFGFGRVLINDDIDLETPEHVLAQTKRALLEAVRS